MKFFSGFSLENEEYLFSSFIDRSDFNVCGFSYGAIKAVKMTLEMLENSQRVDRLQLFSPAFFQTKEEKFKRLQLMSYKKNKQLYIQNFFKSCFTPYENKIVQNIETEIEELRELLEYRWSVESLQAIQEQGVKIEVYLGGKDAIIDVASAKELFVKSATLTYIKDANHFLQIN